MVKVSNFGVQVEEFLRSFPPLESLLLSFLTPCRSVRLLNDVVALGCGDHLLVVDVSQARDLSNRGPVAAKLIGMDDLWDIIFSQQPDQEGFRRFGVTMPLKGEVKHETMLVHGLPESVSNAIDAGAHLVEMPPGTPPGFPVAQVFREEGSEFNAPLAQSLVAELDTALVEQFLNVSVTQWEAMVEPDSMLDDGHGETVAIGFRVSHGRSA